jgi:cobyrinic acid a,c-diamide synthase
MAALRRQGLKVQPFKIGPDFIDPGLHARAAGASAYNLDGWMLPRAYNRRCFEGNVRGKDVAVVEGMMGLYDGQSGASEKGSTAEMAKWLKLPVILVVDASALARSASALLLGYRNFDRRVDLAGVVFNRIGGEGHLKFLRDAMKCLPGLVCFGGLPHDERIKIPERHLGLVTAEENFFDWRFAHCLARWVERHLDLDALLRRTCAPRAPARESPSGKSKTEKIPIAVARDLAFCFYYPDNLAALEAAGARLKFFSPIRERGLPADTKGIYLGGGYPELYARKLARNRSMRTAIRRFIEAGGPVYAECGGFMYLTGALTDCAGRKHPMVGVFPFETRMLPRLRALGYREVLSTRQMFVARGEKMRGHEFHYSELRPSVGDKKIETTYSVLGTGGGRLREGYRYKSCLGSYVHLHFGSNPEFARGFVAACRGSER